MRYLEGRVDYSLCYQGNYLQLKSYTNADWGGDLDEMKSTSGFTFLLNNDAISWSSKKQSCIALSIMEAGFIALLVVVQEGIWLRRFLEHLINKGDAIKSVVISCDSQATIAYTKDPKFHAKTKHIDIKNNFVKDMVAQKEVNVKYITTQEIVAYSFTKTISKEAYFRHVKSLGLHRQ